MSPEHRLGISIIIPAHNEEKSIERCVMRCRSALGALGRPFEVVIAEDGSMDDTCRIAEGLSKKFENVTLLHSDERLGKGGAIMRAAKAAKGEIIVVLDSDLATGLEHLPELVGWIDKGYDIAIGSRLIAGSRVNRSMKRELASRTYNKLVWAVLGSKLRDHQCGFKAFRKDKIVGLLGKVENTSWFWDTEFLVRAQNAGLSVKEFPITWRESDETRIRFFKDSFRMGTSIMALRHRLWRERRAQ